MKCEILASVMNQKNKDAIMRQMQISKNQSCLLINQVTENIKPKDSRANGIQRMISFKERGVSRSRNHAIDNAVGDICIMSDDDVVYIDGYEEIIGNAYKKYPKADMILFHFEYEGNKKQKKLLKEGRVGYLKSMKFGAPQITFLRKSIKNAGVRFDEKFGPGVGKNPKNNWGEESIFLFDCLRRGLKIYYVPATIAIIKDTGTTWDRCNTPEHYERQGAIYRRMSPCFWRLLILQFVLRKHKIYKGMSPFRVFSSMHSGARHYGREKEESVANDSRKRILHYIPTFDCGGVESFFNNMINEMGDESLFYLLVENEVEDNIKKELSKRGVTLIKVPNMTKDSFAKHVKDINRVFRKYSFDVVHVHDCNIRCAVMLQAKLHSVKKRIYHAHSIITDKGFTKRMIKKIGLYMNLIFSNTHLVCSKEVAEAQDIRKYEVINNGINIDKYAYDPEIRNKIRAKYNIPRDQFILLYVGRVVKSKNLPFLFEVLEKLNSEKNRYGLMVVGDGNDMVNLKKYTNRNVYFTGKVLNPSIYYSAGDVFCIPSFSEGFSFVLLEAQANGLPCVASRFIPRKVNVSKTIKYLGVSHSDIDSWVKAIIDISKRKAWRQDNTKRILSHELDALSTAKKIKMIYGGYNA